MCRSSGLRFVLPAPYKGYVVHVSVYAGELQISTTRYSYISQRLVSLNVLYPLSTCLSFAVINQVTVIFVQNNTFRFSCWVCRSK